MSDRSDLLLRGLDLARSIGAEIGPLDRPVVARAAGRVIYVDHCDTGEMRRRWASDPNVRAERIEVDAVWGTNTLKQSIAAATGADTALDYVVASHVIEHVPDMIGWLGEVAEALQASGSLRLAVPDRRYTFDYLRRTSSMTDVLDAYVRRRRVPAGSRVLDFALHMASVDCAQAWAGNIDERALQRGYTREQAIALARDAEDNGTYHDVHCWVFTPESFAKLMHELSDGDLIAFGCDHLAPTARNTIEFFAHLRPMPDRVQRASSWREAIKRLG